MARALAGEHTIRVEGLDDFRRDLRRLGDIENLDALKDANKSVAEIVVQAARARAGGVSPTARRAAASLKARRNQRTAEVSLGDARTPYALGAEFGAARDQPRVVRSRTGTRTIRGWRQFKFWRGNDAGAGYFLWPSIRAKADEIVEQYGKAIDEIAAKAFPE